MQRQILHVDANCFYASVECAENPELIGKPVAVVGDIEARHGIVLTANYLAKRKFGVKTGDVYWQARQKCPELVMLPCNFPLYMRYSDAIRRILGDYSDRVEPFGCDEAWVDVSGNGRIMGTAPEIAEEIRERVKSELNITVSIGVSFCKVLAKLGSDMKKPDAVTVLSREDFREKISHLPVEALLCVGSATSKILYARNVTTIGDLANTPPKLLRSWLGKNGEMLYNYANGNDFSAVALANVRPAPKSIGNSTTTAVNLKTDEEVKRVFFSLADSVAMRMRKKGFYGGGVAIYVKNDELESYSRQHVLEHTTNLSVEIAKIAFELYKTSYDRKRPVRALGISVFRLSQNPGYYQEELSGSMEQRLKQEKLEVLTDEIKARFGRSIIKRGVLLNAGELSDFSSEKEISANTVGFFKGY